MVESVYSAKKQNKMNRLLLTLIIGLIVMCCNNNKQGDNDTDSDNSELIKKESYLNKMKEKNFQLEINGPCDDALEDTIHERSVVYIDSKTLNNKNAIIEFKFIEACCMEFLGDYSIENDTLKFKLEQVNNLVCSCLCWYRYKLTVNEPKEKYKAINIERKSTYP
jgi:hypothetical protein